MNLPIYMDNHSTTRVDPRVVDEMLPYFTVHYGNAASRNHSFGWDADKAVETGRERLAKIINADPREIIFTSGATESNNLALKGVVEMYAEKGNHIITQVTEHRSVLDTAKRLEKNGINVTYLPVYKDGLVDPEDVRKAITERTVLISIMLVNNEIGVIQPIEEIGRIAKEREVLFHCDATQGVGKIKVDVQSMGIDLLSFTAHKLYGPKGVGALYVRRRNPRVRLSPIMDGGGHERGMRSGTLNVPGIAGFGKACEIALEVMDEEASRILYLRERLRKGVVESLGDVHLNGHPTRRMPGNLNLSFAYVEGESLLMGLKEIALSSGSACTSATLEPSYVLQALKVSPELAHSSVRFGLGRFNTEEEVDYVIKRVIETVNRLREMSPLYEMVREGIDLKQVKWAKD
ncbi:MAG TPA: IscS subfamily cysteine desulfurase [Nitrospiraceae bacterium]|nr:IscS subfamily cysteine desulfurase [Nitrospiraceae bacterium]